MLLVLAIELKWRKEYANDYYAIDELANSCLC